VRTRLGIIGEELALEDGFVTKGDGQNLTAFYFKTENG